MKNTVDGFVDEYKGSRRALKRFVALIAVPVLVIAGLVSWWLHDTGVAETDAEACFDILTCVGDATADAETADDWDATLPELTGDLNVDVASIALSQLGYSESTLNYAIDSDGAVCGYTRYGDWYGNTYAGWDAMFVDFCLRHAGLSIDDYPMSSGAYAFSAGLMESGLWEDADSYAPTYGDLAFFDEDGDGSADHLGIVAATTDDGLIVVEGDAQPSEYTVSDADELSEILATSDYAKNCSGGGIPVTASDSDIDSDNQTDTTAVSISDNADADFILNSSDAFFKVTTASGSNDSGSADAYSSLNESAAAGTDEEGTADAVPDSVDDSSADENADETGNVSTADSDLDRTTGSSDSDLGDSPDSYDSRTDTADSETPAASSAASDSGASAQENTSDSVLANFYTWDEASEFILGYGLTTAIVPDADGEIVEDVEDENDGESEDYEIATASDYPIAMANLTGTALTNSNFSSSFTGSAGTFYLSEDVTTSSTITISGDVTLDLNGHKLVYTGSSTFITVSSSHTLTITNSTGMSVTKEQVTGLSSMGSSDGTHIYGNLATLSVSTDTINSLVYYVTESEVDASGTGTTETLYKYTVTPTGYILAQNSLTSDGSKCVIDVKGTLDLQGGIIAGNGQSANLVHVINATESNSKIKMSGSGATSSDSSFTSNCPYVCGGNPSSDWGGGICCTTTFEMSGGVVAANTAHDGGGIYVQNATVNISGGVISGNQANYAEGSGTEARGFGGGIFAYEDNTDSMVLTISGDVYITNNDFTGAEGNGTSNASIYGGGGVATWKGTLIMSGGYVTGNYSSEAGGGMYVGSYGSDANDGTTFTMTDGTVASNYAYSGEGGGIRISGGSTAVIGSKTETTAIYITNNYLADTVDWGGGGVFVQTKGNLTVYNSLVANNSAGGFGGGVAACPTGIVMVAAAYGGAIYDNTASGTQLSGGGNGKADDGTTIGYNSNGDQTGGGDQGFTKCGCTCTGDTCSCGCDCDCSEGSCGASCTCSCDCGTIYQDFYCVHADGTTDLALVFGQMLGNGSANWTTRIDETTTRNIGIGQYFTGKWLIGATANPSENAKAAAIAAAGVFITGNHSAVHGGGIMTNGSVTLGEATNLTTSATLEVTGSKKVTLGSASGSTENIPTEFQTLENAYTFYLLDTQPTLSDSGTWQISSQDITDDSTNVVGTAQTDENGAFTLTLDGEHDLSETSCNTSEGSNAWTGTATYYMIERPGSSDAITYDTTLYKIEITVRKKTTTVYLSSSGSSSTDTISFNTYTIDSASIYKSTDGGLNYGSALTKKGTSGDTETIYDYEETIAEDNTSLLLAFKSGVATFTNIVKTYELPNTGGSGLGGTGLLGFLLAIIALCGLALMLVRSKRGETPRAEALGNPRHGDCRAPSRRFSDQDGRNDSAPEFAARVEIDRAPASKLSGQDGRNNSAPEFLACREHHRTRISESFARKFGTLHNSGRQLLHRAGAPDFRGKHVPQSSGPYMVPPVCHTTFGRRTRLGGDSGDSDSHARTRGNSLRTRFDRIASNLRAAPPRLSTSTRIRGSGPGAFSVQHPPRTSFASSRHTVGGRTEIVRNLRNRIRTRALFRRPRDWIRKRFVFRKPRDWIRERTVFRPPRFGTTRT